MATTAQSAIAVIGMVSVRTRSTSLVSARSQRSKEFCNAIPLKADMRAITSMRPLCAISGHKSIYSISALAGNTR